MKKIKESGADGKESKVDDKESKACSMEREVRGKESSAVSKDSKADIKESEDGSKESKTRLSGPDVARGICMIAIIAGHMGVGFVNQLVYLWHLPVFFLLAGFFLTVKPTKEVIRDKGRRLLLPYFVTSAVILIIAVIKAVIERTNLFETVKTWILAILYGAGGDVAAISIRGIGALWFLWALFFAILIVNFLVEKKYGPLLIIMGAVFGWYSFNYLNIWLPLDLQQGMLAALYLLIGYEIKKAGYHPPTILLAPCLVIAAFGIQHFKGFYLVNNYMGNGWVDFFFSLCASVLILYSGDIISEKNIPGKRILTFFGTNSLLILCLHVVEIDILSIQGAIQKIFTWMQWETNEVAFFLVVFAAKMLYVAVGTLVLNRIWFVRVIFSPFSDSCKPGTV